jgi:hypothetical protein
MKKIVTHALDQARDVVYGRGEREYGHPRNDFLCIAQMWNAYLQKKGIIPPDRGIDERDVAMLMVCLKVARDANKPGLDNAVDICGYAECAERVYSSPQR